MQTTRKTKTVFVLVVIAIEIAEGIIETISPTRGRPWPLPQSERRTNITMTINSSMFKYQITNFDCPLLHKAFDRYRNLTFPFHSEQPLSANAIPAYDNSSLYMLEVHLLKKCEELPYLNMDEQYELKICTPEDPQKGVLITNSVWGALRGLETFSQLVVSVKNALYAINCTMILDFPTYAHRGLMLDTSRHFLPVDVIKENLDLMAMSKFNVFHWHIVDDQSFPYMSTAYPHLSDKGAWSSIHVYNPSEMLEILEYAHLRGIRVIIEFDTPGHTQSWGDGQPGLLTKCYDSNGTPNGKFGPIDPSLEENFKFLKKFLSEVSNRFPDHYLHLGGDEVSFNCWRSSPEINEFMKKLNISDDYAKLEEYYFSRLLDLIHSFPKKKGYIVWEEVFDNGVQIDNDTVIHVWKYSNQPSLYLEELLSVTKAGYHAILSSCWYLNFIAYGPDWHHHYTCDPRGFDGTEEELRRVIGGEACTWGEYVDKTNVIARTWPRACAVAERLWSNPKQTKDPNEAAPRLEEHRCRMMRRGHLVEPLGPSFCEGIL